jgi:hypothetical protein
MRVLARALALVGCVLGTARADDAGFVEALTGVGQPLATQAYADFARSSPKLGVRVGVYAGRWHASRLGLEIGVDWSPQAVAVSRESDASASFDRVRGLFGVRWTIDTRSGARIFFRTAAGFDYVWGQASGNIDGLVLTGELQRDVALALEPGFGVETTTERGLIVGVELALPIRVHGPGREAGFFGYDAYDITWLFKLGASF